MAKTPFGNDRRTNPNADSYRDSHTDTNSHSYRNAKCNPESYTYTYSDIYAYADIDTNTYCHGQSYTKEYSDPETSAPTAPPTDANALGRMRSTIDNK